MLGKGIEKLEKLNIDSIEDIISRLKGIRYGAWDDKTNTPLYMDATNKKIDKRQTYEYMSKYCRILSPEEILKHKVTTCWGITILICYLAYKKDLQIDAYYYECVNKDNIPVTTHMVPAVKYNNKWYLIDYFLGIKQKYNTIKECWNFEDSIREKKNLTIVYRNKNFVKKLIPLFNDKHITIDKIINITGTTVTYNDEFYPKPLTVKILTPLFAKILQIYKKLYNFDLSYMKIDVSDVPLYTNGKPAKNMPVEQFGGCHTKLNYIYINTHFEKAVKFYEKVCDRDTYIQILKLVIAHELAHEIYATQATDNFKRQIQEKIVNEDFTTSYIQSLDTTYTKYDEECFCEYLANQVYLHLNNVDILV